MKYYYLSLFIVFNTCIFSQNTMGNHLFKLPGTQYNSLKFSSINGDTTVTKYEKELVVITKPDTAIYLEIFDLGKKWFVYHYKINNGKPILVGWQQEYNQNGDIEIERYCPLASRKCNYTKRYIYYPNGQILSSGYYKKETPDSTHVYYYTNGQLREIITYQDGKLFNVNAYYDQNKHVLDIGNFCDGEGQINIYSMNGKLIQIKSFKKGKQKKIVNISFN